jgi:hypothetical protein
MSDLIVLPQTNQWQKLKALVLDSVSSPITKRVYNLGLDEFIAWYGQEPPPVTKAKPEVAAAQIEKDSIPATTTGTGSGTGESAGAGTGTTGSGTAGTGGQTGKGTGVGDAKPKVPVLRRFHGSAKIDATRLSRDVDVIASSVVQHLAGLLGAKVTITVEIEAEIPSGAPDNVVRTVTENCRTLKFENSGFDED